MIMHGLSDVLSKSLDFLWGIHQDSIELDDIYIFIDKDSIDNEAYEYLEYQLNF